jgi:hypothetical protein
MYVFGGHAFRPLLMVQQNVVQPSQQRPLAQFRHLMTAWAVSGRSV